MSKAVHDIVEERERQKKIISEDFDMQNTKNDWIAYIGAYAGRASDKVMRNEKEGQKFRDNLVKVGALAVAAIEAYDKGYMK